MRSKFKWILALIVAFTMQFSFAQQKTIKGVVSDANGPLPSANVLVKGTSNGVTTDFDGNYSISAKEGDVLVITFVGMQDKEVAVGASNVINVTLDEGVILDEIVLIGIVGVKRKEENITSAYQKVDKQELNQGTNPNAVSALAGKVTGLQINTTNNGVNQTNSIVLRGTRSISGSNEALVVIDNTVSSAAILQNLAPELIEQMTVLKGGSAAAIYGEAGKNGVIVVTTKSGAEKGKVTVDINSSVTFENISYMAQRQERYGQGWSGNHVTYENGAWGAEFDGVPRTVGMAQADGSYITRPYSPIKNNINKFFQTGYVFQNGLTLSGGNAKDGYATLSFNNQQTEFVVDQDALNRTTGLFKAGKDFGKWSLNSNVQFSKSRTSTTTPNLLQELYQAATNIPVEEFRNSGNEGHWTSYYNNPYWRLENERFDNLRNYFSAQATIGYKFNDNISVNYLINGNMTDIQTEQHVNEYIDLLQIGGGNQSVVSNYFKRNINRFNLYSDLVFNFEYDLTEDFGFNASVGFNAQDRKFNSTRVGGENLTIPGLYNLGNVENPVNDGGLLNGSARSKIYSGFFTADFTYKNYLTLNVTGRNDVSGVLVGGASGNTYFYPSVGLTFIPTNAIEGLKGTKLNFAKVYGNFVRNGSADIGGTGDLVDGAYQVNPTLNVAPGFPFSGSGNSFSNDPTIVNNAIRPEFYTSYEGGLNLGFFKDRLTLDVAAYSTVTTDLITNQSASNTSGVSDVLTNIGQMTNKGFEIDLGFTPIKMKDNGLRWDNRIGYSKYKSVVDKVSDAADEVALTDFGDVSIFAVEGEEFPTIKGTAYLRDDQGRVVIDPTTGNPLRTQEFKILGKANPDYIINYNTSVSYKGLRLAAVMDYRTGHQFWSGTKDWLTWSGHLYESAVNGRTGFIYPNSSYEATPGVYVDNTSIVTGGTSYTSYLAYFQDEFRSVAENSVLDATAFKVRELALSYSMPNKMIERTGLTKLQFGVNARNPFMILPTENRGYSDPEISRSAGNDKGLSVVGQYPITRTFAFTLNASF